MDGDARRGHRALFDEIAGALSAHGVDVAKLLAELEDDLRGVPTRSDDRRPKLRIDATNAVGWANAHATAFRHRMAAELAGVLHVRCAARDRLESHGVREEMLRTIVEPKTSRTKGDAAVVLHDDDVTPFALVVEILESVLAVRPLEAWDLANEVHIGGRAHLVTTNEDDARRIAATIADRARIAGFSLRVTVERAVETAR